MSFTFTDNTEEVWSCDNCSYCSTKRHFNATEDGPTCILCQSPSSKIEEVEISEGMRRTTYMEILGWMSENLTGIGDATIANIEEHFEDGDAFLDACKQGYDNREFDALTEVTGIGKEKAHKKLALGLAEYKGWQDGDAEIFEFGD